eukprot:259249_1
MGAFCTTTICNLDRSDEKYKQLTQRKRAPSCDDVLNTNETHVLPTMPDDASTVQLGNPFGSAEKPIIRIQANRTSNTCVTSTDKYAMICAPEEFLGYDLEGTPAADTQHMELCLELDMSGDDSISSSETSRTGLSTPEVVITPLSPSVFNQPQIEYSITDRSATSTTPVTPLSCNLFKFYFS